MLKFVPLSPTNAHHQLLPSETSAITAKNSVVKDGKTEEDDSRVDINKSSKSTEMYTYTPNLLPCRIHADGPVEKRMNAGDGENRHQDVDGWERYWDPQRPTDCDQGQGPEQKEEHLEAYFRGRKLKGRQVQLPRGYRGSMVMKKEYVSETPGSRGKPGSAEGPGKGGYGVIDIDMDEEEDEEEEEEERPVGVLEEVGTFDEIVLWGHEQVVADDDPYVKGVEEWIALAQAIHGTDDLDSTPT